MTPTTPPEFLERMREAARGLTLKGLLQGRPIGHPFHALLIHLPMGLWPAALVLDCLSRSRGETDPALALTAWWCILGGLASAAAAVPTGVADWWDIKRPRPAWSLGLIHALLNGAAFALFLANFILRCIAGRTEQVVTLTQLVLSAVGVALLLAGGYLGHRLVYEHGVAVARTSKAYWRKIAAAGGAAMRTDGQ